MHTIYSTIVPLTQVVHLPGSVQYTIYSTDVTLKQVVHLPGSVRCTIYSTAVHLTQVVHLPGSMQCTIYSAMTLEGVMGTVNPKTSLFYSLSFLLLSACITINAAQYPEITVTASFVADGY